MDYCNPEASTNKNGGIALANGQHLGTPNENSVPLRSTRGRPRFLRSLRLNQVFEVRAKALDQRLLTADLPPSRPQSCGWAQAPMFRSNKNYAKVGRQTTLELLIIASHGENQAVLM